MMALPTHDEMVLKKAIEITDSMLNVKGVGMESAHECGLKAVELILNDLVIPLGVESNTYKLYVDVQKKLKSMI